jgi:aspartate-semialdehyde dehydrogenase
MKMCWETRKIFADPAIGVNATAVRVPVFFGHSEAIHLETVDKITVREARRLLHNAPGVKLLDRRVPGGYPTAAKEGSGSDPVWVGRIREDISHPRGLSLWVVADNIRKGAALNSVQIAESFVKNYM